MNPANQQALRTKWGELLLAAGAPPDHGPRVFDRIVGAYSTAGRYYHTLDHVAYVLQIIDDMADLAANPIAVRFAAWFHDAIYEPRATDNEERSADFAKQQLVRLELDPLCGHVAELILATKSHQASDADSAVLLDADLAILAAEPNRYDEYAHQIKEEYRWAPDPDYRAGRRRVLEAFTNRPFIFQTNRMRGLLESRARANITRELAAL